jgi:hypothetical protein
MGMPEYEAKRYESSIKEGKVLISVHSDNADETKRAKDIFEQAGAEDISTSGEEKVPKDRRQRTERVATTTTTRPSGTRPAATETTRQYGKNEGGDCGCGD